jgi:uncharacterized protein YbbK (DUF523 family)
MGCLILVSACLAGLRTNYAGTDNLDKRIADLVAEGITMPACPEQLGGLATPRGRAEIVGGDGADVLAGKARVMDELGRDVTESFVRGAEEVLRLAKLAGAKRAILKSRSPSCGCRVIYDGTFSHRLMAGDGVTAALLRANGIEVCAEEDREGLQNPAT